MTVITQIEISDIIKNNCGLTRMGIWRLIPKPNSLSYTDFMYIIEELIEEKCIAIDGDETYSIVEEKEKKND